MAVPMIPNNNFMCGLALFQFLSFASVYLAASKREKHKFHRDFAGASWKLIILHFSNIFYLNLYLLNVTLVYANNKHWRNKQSNKLS